MPVFKLTLIFNFSSAASTPNFPGRRTGGWTESYYATADTPVALLNSATSPPVGIGLFQARAALLPIGSAIVGFRTQQVSPQGSSQAGAVSYPGASGLTADTPQTSLLVKVPGVGVGNIRRWKLKGIPDLEIVEGEYQPGATFQQAMSAFFGVLSFWQFRGRDISQPSNKIVSITAAGVITFEQNVNYQLLQFIRVLKTLDQNKILRGARVQVTVLGPAGNVLTVAPWTFGATTGGNARLDGIIYPAFNGPAGSVSRVVIAKVGRSPFQYRGRRSKRH